MIKRRDIILILMVITILILGYFRNYMNGFFGLIVGFVIMIFGFILMNKTNYAFLSYIILLLIVSLFREPKESLSNLSMEKLINWVPYVFTNKTVFTNVFGNILLYIPIGFFFRSKTNAINAIVFSFVIIGIIEVIQAKMNLGVFDVGDIFLNLLGVCFGYICYMIWRWYLWQKETKMEKFKKS